MKIKLLGLFEDDIKNGFETHKEYIVNKVEISGDYCAYDIWYYITNEKGNTTCFQDLNVKESETDEKLNYFILRFINFQREINLPYKFNFKIDLD